MQIASVERYRVSAVQDIVLEYVIERSWEVWRLDLLKPCGSTDRIRLVTYASMVRATEDPILLDPNGEVMGFLSLVRQRAWTYENFFLAGFGSSIAEEECLQEPSKRAL